MNVPRPPITYTEGKRIAWACIPTSAIVLALAVAAVREGKTGFAIAGLVLGGWVAVMGVLQFAMNGKSATMTVSDEGVSFADGLFVAFSDMEKITFINPLPNIFGSFLNIVFHVRPDMAVKQAGRSLRRAFCLTTVGGNISMVGKHKMFSFMTPGIRPVDGPKMDQDDILDDLFARFDTLQNR
ncbi:hypothetical protein CR152_31715 [Massilia violaceinigra]|uniref:Uncharacterized protein n=1 Tax=Massilia violaceinigra TaxID=2045208 RepID=A0A2D2DUC9_9BURK|nr:hypothetical protein [Massilia violaceinigra]ATQ78577.1 hypothetical protein CR152_31715 [Massilia violaceinigra]